MYSQVKGKPHVPNNKQVSHICFEKKKTFDINVFISSTVSIPQFYMILYTLYAPVVDLSIVLCFLSRLIRFFYKMLLLSYK